MDIRKIAVGLSGALLLASGDVSAQSGIEVTSTNPFEKQLLIEFENGTVAIADDNTQRIYLATNSGQEFEISFADAVAAAESDPVKRRQMLQEFRASLTDRDHMVTIRRPRVATDETYWPRYQSCGDVICIDPFSSSTSASTVDPFSTASNTGDCNHYLCPKLPWPCDMGPCSPNEWDGGLTFYSSFLGGWGDDQGGGSVTQQELVSYDKKLWESQRQTACSEKNVIAANTSLTAAATGGACLLAETGVGAVVCVAGIVSYGIGVYQTHKKTKECFATYPGIGKW